MKNKLKLLINKERAEYIRDLRVNKEFSWRKIARDCHNKFGKGFSKKWDAIPSNQLWGMDLCDTAADFFGENYLTGKWN